MVFQQDQSTRRRVSEPPSKLDGARQHPYALSVGNGDPRSWSKSGRDTSRRFSTGEYGRVGERNEVGSKNMVGEVSLAHDGERVKVYVRVRPVRSQGETDGALVMHENSSSTKVTLHRTKHGPQNFVFDKVLPPSASQSDVYDVAAEEIVQDVLKGYNGTLLAYGQTGAGKTHTLSSINPQAIGIIPRAAQQIFATATLENGFAVTLSYLQIYCEQIQDLLKPESGDNLTLRETEKGHVYVPDLSEVEVQSLDDCLRLLQLGERNRTVAFTALNAHSSRSHAVVILTVTKQMDDGNGVQVGRLFMVDLAGSERLKKSKSVGQRAFEARAINLSLTTLGKCVSARAAGPSTHVPFRDSKLTRLLQESLGGNARTSMIIAVAGAMEHCEETLQSFQFGSRAMRVQTHAEVNVQSSESRPEFIMPSPKYLKSSLEAKLDGAYAQLKAEQEKSRKVIEILEQEKTQAQEEKMQLEDQHEKALNEERLEKQALMQRILAAEETRRNADEAASEKISYLRKQLDDAMHQLDAMEKRVEDKEAYFNQETKELISRKDMEIRAMQEKYESQLQVKEAEWRRLDAEKTSIVSGLTQEIGAYEHKIELLETMLQQKTKEEARSMEKLHSAEEKVECLERDNASNMAAMRELQKDREEERLLFRDQENKLKTSLISRDTEHETALANAESKFKETISSYEKEMLKMKSSLENGEKKLVATREALEDIKTEADRVHKENRKLRKALKEAQDNLKRKAKEVKESEFKFEILNRHYKRQEVENKAATVIQRAYRNYRMKILNKQRAEGCEELAKAKSALGNLAAKHAELSEKRASNLAFAGQTLLGEGLQVLHEAVEGLLATFLLPSKDLKAVQRYKQKSDLKTMPTQVWHCNNADQLQHDMISVTVFENLSETSQHPV